MSFNNHHYLILYHYLAKTSCLLQKGKTRYRAKGLFAKIKGFITGWPRKKIEGKAQICLSDQWFWRDFMR